MTQVIKPVGKAPVDQVKAAAKANGAKGTALATVCVAYATKCAKEDESRSEKLRSIVKSIGDLTREGHVAFRSELQAELDMIASLEKGVGAEKRTMGYSMNSFRTMVSNWKTISQACELGLKTKDADDAPKSWGQVLGEAVHIKHAHASDSQNPATPTKRKAGRKTLTDLDRAKAAFDKLTGQDIVKLAAYVQTRLTLARAATPETATA